MNNKERIYAYLRNEMEHLERIDFEEEIASNPKLAEEVRLANIKGTYLHRNEDDSGHFEKAAGSAKRKSSVRNIHLFFTSSSINFKYLWGISFAIGIISVILLVYICQIKIAQSEKPYTKEEIIENLPIYNELDYYMDSHKFEKALLVIDSLQKDLLLIYSKSTIKYENDSTLQRKEKEKAYTSKILYELTWKKIKILMALQELDQSSILLKDFKEKKGSHQKEAKNLWKELN